MRAAMAFLLALGLGAAEARAPDTSPRPVLRGAPAGSAAGPAAEAPSKVRIIRTTASALAPARSRRPEARGGTRAATALRATTEQPTDGVRIVRVAPGEAQSAQASLRPKPRPKVVVRRSTGAQTQQAGLFKRKEPRVTSKGAVCGVKEIKGTKIAPIPGRIRGCGVQSPVAVTSVSGVALSTPAKIDCGTAKALNSWVKNTVKPTVGRLGGGVSSLRVAAHYACRTRNNRKGAKISEHGKGRAIDISALTLKNGKSITVLNGWGRSVEGKILRRLHKGACGPFGTVLGPNSDRFHRDHFHFDTARYRSGPYCR